VISIFLFLPRLLPGFRPSLALDRNVVRQVRRFSFTNYVADFLGSAPSFVLPLIVLRQAGPESTAYFAIAWALAGFLALIPGALSLSLFAEGSREEERLGIHASRAFTLAIVLVPVVLVAVIFAPQILLLYGKSYSSGSVAAFRLLALAAFASAALSLYMSVARVRGKLSWVLAVNAVPAVVGIGFAYVGLNHWGIVGVAGAWLAVQTAGAVAATASLRWSKILRS
ncbi:MAG: hypothetical protein HYX90_00600, partial [Chloroflexi bacterium]|nr:hypothetical protein [Chloroflexota bacterium]